MTSIHEEHAAEGANAAPAANTTADHPNPGGAPPLVDAPFALPGSADENTAATANTNANANANTTDSGPAPAHASSLPDAAAQVQTHAHAQPSADASTPAASSEPDPFSHTDDAEPTPALPPRPEFVGADPAGTMSAAATATAGAETAVHAGGDAHAHANANATANEQGQEQEERTSPQAAALRSMFPDFDLAVLQSVLDSVNGDQERAIDILLGMSDPEYVSTQTAEQQAGNPSLDLDEQLARQLMLEDQQQQQRHATGTSWPRRDQADVPYQARQAPPASGQNRVPPAESRTDLQELQRTMGQIAESGKRTFSSIMSKVKAKINEYETSRNNGQASSASAPPQWGTPASGQLDRHTASQAYQQQYYGAEPGPVAEQPITLGPPREPVQGYNLDAPAPAPAPVPIASPVPTPGSAGPTTPSTGAPQLSPAASPRPSSGDVPRPPTTASGSPVNAAKIGLLPRKPVSLLSANSPPKTRPSDEDDELEYVENPFEDRK